MNYWKKYFKYEIWIKGGHSDKFILADKLIKPSLASKSVLNHGLHQGFSNEKIVRMNKKHCLSNNTTGVLGGLKLKPRDINNSRYYKNKTGAGTFKEGFEKVMDNFNNGQYKYLRVYDHDPLNLIISIFVKCKDFKFIKRIYQFYLDGTFKIINIPESLRNIPIAINISSDVYEKL
jgi:hypothetical protein